MNIAIIPARGGSKRIPKKNIKDFCGKPIIAWSIESAIKSKCFDRVIVSTDDNEIAEVSKFYGAEIPFIRPSNISDDYTQTSKVISHCIEWFQSNNEYISYACCLYPTAPFVTPDDLIKSYKIISSSNYDYVFPVCTYDYSVFRGFTIDDNNKIKMLESDNYNKRSQDLTTVWHDVGQYYWGKAKTWINETLIFSSHSYPIKSPRYKFHDIDNFDDWHIAENLFLNFK